MQKKVQNIPDTTPATSQDCFNYSVRYVRFTNSTIQAVIHFRGKPDTVRLARAVKLSVDAEPVLGCKFIEREDRPFWQRLTGQTVFRSFFASTSQLAPHSAVQL